MIILMSYKCYCPYNSIFLSLPKLLRPHDHYSLFSNINMQIWMKTCSICPIYSFSIIFKFSFIATLRVVILQCLPHAFEY